MNQDATQHPSHKNSPKRTLRAARQRLAVRMANSGLTVRQIASDMKVSESTVYKYLHDAHETLPKDKQAELCVKLALEELPASEIAKRTGLSRRAVNYHLRKMGLSPKVEKGRPSGHGRKYLSNQRRAVELYQRGTPVTDIADKLDRSRQAIYDYLEDAGVTLRSVPSSKEAVKKREQRIVSARERGLSYGQIAEEVGVNTSTVRRHLSKADPERSARRKRQIEERRRKAASMYRDGEAVTKIAMRVGVSPPTIYGYLRDKGVELRPDPRHDGKHDERKVEAVRLRQEGLTLKAISERLGVHFQTVTGYMKEAREEGVLLPRHSQEENRRGKQVRSLLEQNVLATDIAKRLEMTPEEVSLHVWRIARAKSGA